MKKRWLAATLAAVMTVGCFTGCGNNSAGGTAPGQGKESDGGAESVVASTAGGSAALGAGGEKSPVAVGLAGGEAFAEQVEIKIPIYDRNLEGMPAVDNNYWTKWIQKEFGETYNIKLTYVPIPRGDEVTKMNMLIAAGQEECPNIIFHFDYPAIMNYYNEGAFQEIDMEQLKQVAPAFYQAMSDNDVLKFLQVDGKDMFVSGIRMPQYTWIRLIRQDWLDAVDKEMPTTYDEFLDVMQAWKEAGLSEYPVGMSLPSNGYAQDQIFRDYPIDELDWALYPDTTVASLPYEATCKMLKQWNSQYNLGLISPEYDLDTTGAQIKADWIAGKTGVYGGFISKNADFVVEMMANNPEARLAVLNPYSMCEDGQVPVTRKTWSFGLLSGFSVYSTPEQVKACEMYLEWLYLNLYTIQNGIEGVNYELVDGIPSAVDYEGQERLNYSNNSDMYSVVMTGFDYGSDEANAKASVMTYAPDGFESLMEENIKWTDDIAKYAYEDYLYTQTIPEVSKYSADLVRLWQEYSVELVKCSESEFEPLYQELAGTYLEAGYREILDARRKIYEASR